MRDVRAKLSSPVYVPADDLLLLRSCIIQQEDANFRHLRLPTYFREGITGDQLKVDCADIISYNAELAKYVLENPTESLPLVRLLLPARLITTPKKLALHCSLPLRNPIRRGGLPWLALQVSPNEFVKSPAHCEPHASGV